MNCRLLWFCADPGEKGDLLIWGTDCLFVTVTNSATRVFIIIYNAWVCVTVHAYYLRGEIVVIALCPSANCYDCFSAAPNAIPHYAQRPALGDYGSKPALLQCVEGSFLVTCCIHVRTVLRRAAYFFDWKFLLRF